MVEDFDAWYADARPPMAVALTVWCGDPALASDALDEAFVRAIERWERVRHLASPGGWVWSTATNVVRRRVRRHRVEARACCGTPRGNCFEYAGSTATTDADGVLRATVTTHAAIYGYSGRTDCTTVECVVVLHLHVGEPLVEVALAFDEDVTAPEPGLELDPPGPHSDGQAVTVHGTGFPPGTDLTDQLALCPADTDPALENRCSYPVTPHVLVDADGTFSTTVRLVTTPRLTDTCTTGPGCVFGWVIPNGPLIVSVPLDFEDAGGSG